MEVITKVMTCERMAWPLVKDDHGMEGTHRGGVLIGSPWQRAFTASGCGEGDALRYVLRRNRGLSLTDTIFTRSRTDKMPTTLLSSVTAR